jgi:hypothetical protein
MQFWSHFDRSRTSKNSVQLFSEILDHRFLLQMMKDHFFLERGFGDSYTLAFARKNKKQLEAARSQEGDLC